MQKATIHELTVMLALIVVAAVVFVQTRSLSTATVGEIGPATFPRLAAGALGSMALLRLFLIATRRHTGHGDYDWSWSRIRRPLAAAIQIVAYYFLFELVPFAVLTFGLVLLSYLAFGIRPLTTALIGSVVATAAFYVLFVFLLRIPV